MTNKFLPIIIGIFIGLLVACGGGSGSKIDVSDVLGIPSGNKEGTGLTGTFASIFEATSGGCEDFPSLLVPLEGNKRPINIEVVQETGDLSFDLAAIEGPMARGAAYFDNSFSIGGTTSISRGGTDNILLIAQVEGEFADADSYGGEGILRYLGRIESTEVDCSIRFDLTGIRE